MDKNNALVKPNDDRKVFCSIHPKSNAERVALFNALEQCDVRLNDEVGSEIDIKDVYIQEYEKPDTNTGELRKAHRTILFDVNGKTHVTSSNYFYVSMAKIMDVFGTPDQWDQPIRIKVVKKSVQNNRQALSLQIIETEKATENTNVVEGEVTD